MWKNISIAKYNFTNLRYLPFLMAVTIFGILAIFANLTIGSTKANAAFKNYTVVTNTSSTNSVDVNCPSGSNAISGGASFSSSVGSSGFISESYPIPSGSSATGWHISYGNLSAGDIVTGYAVCAKTN